MRPKIKKAEVVGLPRGNRVVKLSLNENVEEIYTTSIRRGEIRGWKRHKKMTCRLHVLAGSVEITIKGTKFKSFQHLLNNDKPEIFVIPPKTWFLFKGIADYSIILNFPDLTHDPNEVERKNLA